MAILLSLSHMVFTTGFYLSTHAAVVLCRSSRSKVYRYFTRSLMENTKCLPTSGRRLYNGFWKKKSIDLLHKANAGRIDLFRFKKSRRDEIIIEKEDQVKIITPLDSRLNKL